MLGTPCSSFHCASEQPRNAGFGNQTAIDGVSHDALFDVSFLAASVQVLAQLFIQAFPPLQPYDKVPMGNCAEETAKKHNVSREDQDTYALESYDRAAKAWSSGAFDAEIAPHTISDRRGDTVVKEDEEYKNVKPEKVRSLRPVFVKDGTVTAANASKINDGASAVVVASKSKAEELGVKPLAKILGRSSRPCLLRLIIRTHFF